MGVTAELKIVLMANDVAVAESNDPQLWQKVLAAINSKIEGEISEVGIEKRDQEVNNEIYEGDEGSELKALEEFSAEIGVPLDLVKGACGPTNEAPYIHLDKHHWAALKKATPQRGPKAIAPITLALTLLILWKDRARLGKATVKEAQKVLGTIDLRDTKPSRGIANCAWLQERSGSIIINPAQIASAIQLARSYCTKDFS